MLLCVIMVASMLPVSALAFLLPVSRAASEPDYTVTFVKDAFNTQKVEVYTRIDETGDSLDIPDATLDGKSFQLPEGASMTASGLADGYGLLNVEVGGQRYYLVDATWGNESGSSVISIFNYDIVQQKGSLGIYLHYVAATSQRISATAWDTTGNGSKITTGSIHAGNLTEDVGQALVAGQSGTWYFSGAELRPKANGAQAGSNSIPIDSIRLENGYYYVTTSLSDQGQVAFVKDDWDVYLLYEPAYQLTINVSNVNNTASSIDGVSIGNGDSTRTYQVPRNDNVDVFFDFGTRAELVLTDTTDGSEVLFDSKNNNYQIKEYTQSFTMNKDRTVTAVFTARSNFTLDFTQYRDENDSYHGGVMAIRSSSSNNYETLSISGTGKLTTTIAPNYQLRIRQDVGGGTPYVVDTIVINGQFVSLPTGFSWTGSSGSPWESTLNNVTIYANDGETVMARMNVYSYVEYGTNGKISVAATTLTFTAINTNLVIDRINRTPEDYPGTTVTDIGEGLDATFTRRSSGTTTAFHEGDAVYAPHQPLYVNVTPQFGYYVKSWSLTKQDGLPDSLLFAGSDRDKWAGMMQYYVESASTAGVYAQTNYNKINTAGLSTSTIDSAKVQFYFRYHQTAAQSSAAVQQGSAFTLGISDSVSPALPDTAPISVPDGQTLVGWSLSPNTTPDTSNAVVYRAGQTIPRAVIAASQAVTYGTTAGIGYIDLYPVFEDAASGDFVTYTVYIHQGTDGEGVPYQYTGLAGSVLDRDSVLALSNVNNYVSSLTDYALDGGASDSMVTLSHSGVNQFHLYYNTTANVDITFASKYGFVSQQTEADGDGYHRVTAAATPNSAMSNVNIPTPSEERANASFVGWNTDPQAVVGFTSTELQNTVVPSQNTTYYAIYVPDVTLTFYTWSPEGQWSQDATEITVKNGQTISSENGTKIGNLEKSYTGYTFQGWIPGAIFGTPTDHDALMRETFTSDTTFYASYQAQSNVTLTFNANGGSFPEGASVSGGSLNKEKTVLTYENQTVDSTVTPPQPTPSGSKTFVGWSTDNSDTVGAMSVTVTPAGGTYYALWIDTALTVSVNDPNNIIYDGTAKEPELTVKLGDTVISKGDYTVNYNGTNINAGTAVGTVTVTNGVHRGKAGMVTFTIQPRDIKDVTVEGISNSYPYTGSMITPKVTVTDSTLPESTQITSKTLKPGTHYTVTYGDGDHKNTDVAEGGVVTITGIGNYKGSVTQNFSIIVDSKVTLTVMPIVDYEVNYQEQDGKYTAVQPEGLTANKVLVYDSHMRVLTGPNDVQNPADADYTIEWPTDGWDVGQKTLRVVGQGNYVGKAASVTFRITAKSVNLKLTVTPMVMEVGGGDPLITVTAQPSGTQLTEKTHYTLSYMKYDEQSNSYVASSENAMKTEPGIYRVTATGINEYQGATGQHVFVRTQRTANADGYAVSIPNLTGLVYDGTDHNASGKLLSTIRVEKQKEEHDGEWETVTPTSITINSITRTRGGTNENITVTDGTDLKQAPMVDAGMYSISVTVKPDNTESTFDATLSVYIAPKSISSADIKFTPVNVADKQPYEQDGNTLLFAKQYTGQAQDHSFKLVDTAITGSDDGHYKLEGVDEETTNNQTDGTADTNPYAGKDYYIAAHHHNDHFNAGDYQLTIVGTGNYDGTLTKVFTILPRTLTVGTKDDSGADDITLSYGYTEAEATAALATLQTAVNNQIVESDQETGAGTDAKASVTLYVDSYLDAGNDQPHIHATLAGENRGNYTLTQETIYANVDVTPMELGGKYTPTEGNETPNVTVTLTSGNSAAYTGGPHTPAVQVTNNRLNRLLSPGEYDIVYKYLGTDDTTEEKEVHEIKEVGVYQIVIKAKDNTNYTGENTTARFTVTAPTATTGQFTVSLEYDTFQYTGENLEPKVYVLFGGRDVPQEGTTAAEGAAGAFKVTYSGNRNVGTASVQIDGTGIYSALHVTRTFTITQKPLTPEMVTVTTPVTYTGSPIAPAVTVKDGTTTLAANTDYTVHYYKGSSPVDTMVDAGSYTVRVVGQGNYSGFVNETFTISKADLSTGEGGGFTVRAYPAVGVFDGTNHATEGKFQLLVTYNGKVLAEGDYSVSYTKDSQSTTVVRDVGVYTVTVTGKGDNYTGSATTTYQIVQHQEESTALKVDLTIPEGGYTYDGTEKKPAVKVTAGSDNTPLRQGADASASGADYWVEYQNNIDAGQATVIVRGLGENYGGRIAVATFQIGQRDIDQATVDTIPAEPFTGGQITPTVTVKDTGLGTGADEGRKSLKLYQDYTVTYGPNVEVKDGQTNEGSVTITGTGNYKGSKTVTFDIQPASISGGDGTDPAAGFTVDVYPPSAPYIAKGQAPTVVVHHGSQLLVKDKDYTLTFTPKDSGATGAMDGDLPKDPGDYDVKVTGMGNYEGTVTETFTITSVAENDQTARLVISTIAPQTYTGSQLNPTLTVTPYIGDEAQTALNQEQYSISWNGDHTNAGVHFVTVTANSTAGDGGAYSGLTATAVFVINPKDLGETGNGSVSVTVADTGLTYNGSAHTPTVTTTYTPSDGNANTLSAGDYILVYENNINAGDDATVTVYGRGNYTGSKQATFAIAKSGTEGGSSGGDTAGFTVSVHPSRDVFTGVKHTPYVQVVDSTSKRILNEDEYDLKWTGEGDLIQAGDYTVTATAAENSNYQGSASAKYTITQPSAGSGELEVSVTAGQTFTYDGTAHVPNITVHYMGNAITDYDVSYAKDGTPVEEGSLIDAGTYTITVTGKGSYNTLTGTTTFTIQPRDISNATVAVSGTYYFNGAQIQPEADKITVKDSAMPEGRQNLTADKDYGNITYGANNTAGTDAGSVTVTGRGNYTGTATGRFTILSAGAGGNVSGGKLEIAPIGDVTYTGEKLEPALTVTWVSKDGNTIHTLGAGDYDAEYTNNKAVGPATVTVTGKGNYAGLTAQARFNIVASLLHLDVEVSPKIAQVDASPNDVNVTVKLDNETLTLVTDGTSDGYTLTYRKYNTDGTLGNETTLTSENIGTTLSEQGMYLITAKGSGKYAGAIGTETFVRVPDTSENSFDITWGDNPYVDKDGVIRSTYDGTNQKDKLLSGLTVTVPGEPPTGGTSVTVNDYKMEITYNGGTPSSDYESTNMTNAGVYVVTITGKDNSGGEGSGYSSYSAQIVVLIEPRDISGTTVQVGTQAGRRAGTFTYNGTEQIAYLSITDEGITIDDNPASLTHTTDYTLSPMTADSGLTVTENQLKATDAKTYQVLITGTGNYAGVKTANFTIDPAELTVSGVSIVLTFGDPLPEMKEVTDTPDAQGEYQVTGRMPESGTAQDDVTVKLTASVDGVFEDRSFDATLAGDKASNYTVKVAENFTLTVNPLDLTGEGPDDTIKDDDDDGSITAGSVTVTMSPTSKEYTGQPHTPTVTVKNGDDTLNQSSDYTVTYGDGETGKVNGQGQMVSPGDYIVTISGIGNYKGTFIFTYTITPKADDDKDTDGDGYIEDGGDGNITTGAYQVSLSSTSGYHNGKPHTPKVNVTFINSALQEGTHFNVQYLSGGSTVTNMVDIGTYTVRVIGIGEHNNLKCDLTYTIEKTPEGGGSTGGGGGGGGGGVATYTITAEAGSGGVINPSGEVKVNSGSDYTFTITANKGYEIDDVLVDGESVGAVNRYVFEDVKKSHTIKVSFVRSGEVEEPVVADPDDTGVSGWLITDEHIAYVSGYPDGRFGPNGNMTRAEAAQMFYNLLQDKNVAITVQFTDVADSAWYAKAVNTLASLGIINGVGNDKFAPERSITRAEFTAIAMRFSDGGAAGSNIFTDVSASAWYYDYVIGATGYGWIAGYSDGTFRPDKTITRAEVTTIVNRMLGRSADEAYVDSHRNELMQFTDVDASYWGYYQIMEAANSHDFTKNQNTESWTGLK